MYTTTKITCLTCEQPFEWTAAEQQEYAARGWVPPLRCVKCRELMRRERERALAGLPSTRRALPMR